MNKLEKTREQVMKKFWTSCEQIVNEGIAIVVLLDLLELKTTSMGGWSGGWVVED